MPKIPEYLVERLKADVDNTSTAAVGKATQLGQSIVWNIYNGQTHCQDGTLEKLINKYGSPIPDAANTLTEKERQLHGVTLPERSFLVRADYSAERLTEQLQRANKWTMTGSNLRRHDQRRHEIENFVSQGGSIEALLVDPRSAACRFSAFQECGNDTPASLSAFVKRLNNSRDWLCQLKTKNNNESYERVEIKKIAYPLSFGIDAIEFEGGGGVVYIRFYPLMIDENEKDRPIIEIGDENREWFVFFRMQLDRHLSRAKSWNCPRASKKNRK